MASISGRDALDDRDVLRCGVLGGRGGIEPVDVGEEHEQVGAGHGGDASSEPVIIAIADFRRGDRCRSR